MEEINVLNQELNTYRLKLRPINISDLDDLYEYAKVEGVGELAGWPHHKSIDETKKILDLMISGNNIFSIVYKENNKMIGTLGLHKPTKPLEGKYGLEIGYVLSKDYWGIGLATEAVREVMRWLFLEKNIPYISVCHDINNPKSERVIIKNGFKFSFDFEYKTQMNTLVKSKYYYILREDYLKKKEIIQRFNETYPNDKLYEETM